MFFSSKMIGVLAFLLFQVGNFELDLTSHLFYTFFFCSFHYTILLYHIMVDGLRMDGLVRVVDTCG